MTEHYTYLLSTLRELKGAPLSVLVAIALAARPVGAVWLSDQTGYKNPAVTQALRKLARPENAFILSSGRYSGWLLAQFHYLPDTLSPVNAQSALVMGRPLLDRLSSLKAAPLAVLVAMALAGQPVGANWLKDITGYEDEAVGTALRYLAMPECGLVLHNGRYGANTLAQGMQLPLMAGNETSPVFLDSSQEKPDSRPTTTTYLINHEEGVVSSSKGASPENLDSTLKPDDPSTVQRSAIVRELLDVGVGLKKAHELARLPHATLEYVQAHLRYGFQQKKDLALILHRIKSADPLPLTEARREAYLARFQDPPEIFETPMTPPSTPNPAALPIPVTDGDRSSPAFAAWRDALTLLARDTPRAVFETYLQPARWVAFQDGRLTIGVYDAYHRDWLTERMTSTLARLLTGLLNQPVTIQFIVF